MYQQQPQLSTDSSNASSASSRDSRDGSKRSHHRQQKLNDRRVKMHARKHLEERSKEMGFLCASPSMVRVHRSAEQSHYF